MLLQVLIWNVQYKFRGRYICQRNRILAIALGKHPPNYLPSPLTKEFLGCDPLPGWRWEDRGSPGASGSDRALFDFPTENISEPPILVFCDNLSVRESSLSPILTFMLRLSIERPTIGRFRAILKLSNEWPMEESHVSFWIWQTPPTKQSSVFQTPDFNLHQ